MYAVSHVSPTRFCAVYVSHFLAFASYAVFPIQKNHPGVPDFPSNHLSLEETTSLTLLTPPSSRANSPPPTRLHRLLSLLRLDPKPSTQYFVEADIRSQVPYRGSFTRADWVELLGDFQVRSSTPQIAAHFPRLEGLDIPLSSGHNRQPLRLFRSRTHRRIPRSKSHPANPRS